jgi:hypothetical protein
VAPAASGGAAPGRQESGDSLGLGDITDQNYLTVLGRALDAVGWSDEKADEYSAKTFGIAHWDELGRSQAEKLITVLQTQKPSDTEPTPA